MWRLSKQYYIPWNRKAIMCQYYDNNTVTVKAMRILQWHNEMLICAFDALP